MYFIFLTDCFLHCLVLFSLDLIKFNISLFICVSLFCIHEVNCLQTLCEKVNNHTKYIRVYACKILYLKNMCILKENLYTL